MAEKHASLLDDAGLSSVGTPKGATGKSGSNQGTKLALALGLLIVAALVVCYSQGWIIGAKDEKPPPPTQEEIKAYDQQKKTMEDKVKTHQMPPPNGA